MDSHLLHSSSPTLTNPDMILPYDDNEIPISNDPWSDTLNELDFSSISGPPPLSLMIPRTPVFYVNRTLLSDIGEVTEVEGTPSGLDSASTDRGKFGKSPIYLSSQTGPVSESESISNQEKTVKQRSQISNKSTNTVSSVSEFSEAFKDIRDDVSVGDSVFQGDDEESDTSTDEEAIFPGSRCVVLGHNQSKYNENTSAALSKRAEEILHKAKKRLHTMEGNFNRARSSITPERSSSVYSNQSSSSLSRSTPSPMQNEPQKVEPSGLRGSRIIKLDAPFESDNESPNEPGKYSDRLTYKVNPARFMWQRETGSRHYGGNGSHSSAPSSEDTKENWKASPHSFTNSVETPPSGPLETPVTHVDHQTPGVNQFFNKQNSGKICSQIGERRDLSHSTSSLQMREMQCQMEDLKGRLSALRERTRENSLRCRSQQSLRTPSPFTASEKTYSGEKYFYNESPLNIDSETDNRNIKDNEGNTDSKTEELRPSSNHQICRSEKAFSKITGCDLISKSEENKDDLGADEDDFEKSHSTRLSSIEETNDVSEREIWSDEDATISHENREDAFDYQHIFLHSELGTINRQSRYSMSSDDSGETTRGFPSPNENRRKLRWGLTKTRSESTDTLSTNSSYATATESFEEEGCSEDSEAGEFAVRRLGSAVPEIGSLNDRVHQRYPKKSQVYQKKNITKLPVSKNSHPIRSNLQSSSKTPSSAGSLKQTDNLIQYTLNVDMSKRLQGKTMFAIYEARPFSSGSTSRFSDHSMEPTRTDRKLKFPGLSPVDMLSKDDEIHLSQLLDSLAECVLSLKESNINCDAHAWRRRIDTARRVLEGMESDA